MPVKMRLARHGKKNKPFYFIMVADSRSPRDGRFIERIGSYNPNTDPATIELDFDKALNWLSKGAQPTDTVRAILSYEGVLLKKHLFEGVKKGALNEEQAEAKFQTWKNAQEAKIQDKKAKLKAEAEAKKKGIFVTESEVNKQRAAVIAKRKADAIAAITAPPAAEESEEA